MINYLIEVTLCLAVFYGLYTFLLKRETFFQLNRYYLLGTLLGGLLIPLLEIAPSNSFAQQFQQVILLPEATITSQFASPTVEPTIGATVDQTTSFGWSDFILVIYVLALFGMTLRLLAGLYQIYQLKRQGTEIPKHNYTRIETTKSHAPFSFFHYLFMNEDTSLSNTERNQIISHELAHIKGRHSMDVILVELLSVFLWFHPLIFLYKRSIKENHEYLADQAVIQFANKQQYSRLLVEQAIPGLRLANNFNHSLLKKRIKMMSLIKSNNVNLLKYLVCIPMLGMVLFLFSCKKDLQAQLQQTEVQQTDNVKTGVLADPEAKAILDNLSEASKAGDTDEASNKWVQFQQHLAKNAKKNENGYYTNVEENPIFPGCEAKSMNYVDKSKCASKLQLEFIYQNISYPEEAKESGIEGMVLISFVVDKQGNTFGHKISKGIGGGCDKEALRVAKQMPNWIPGKHKGEAVDVEITMPIRFKLNS